jgi:sec-independent protein translocase protein TatA
VSANIIGPELLVILAIAALLFGGSRLPHLARSVGAARGEFERGLREPNGGSSVRDDARPDERVPEHSMPEDAMPEGAK